MNTFIWIVGCLLVILSWFKVIPIWLGWFGFVGATFLASTTPVSWGFFEWSALWVIGALLILLSWIGFLHKVFAWGGMFLTLISVGMEWITEYSRTLQPEPLAFFDYTVDLLFIMFVLNYISIKWFFFVVKNNEHILLINQQIYRLNQMTDLLEKRTSPEMFHRRSLLIFHAMLTKCWEFLEYLGKWLSQSTLVGTIIFLCIAFNYYDSDAQFDFILFSVNWFLASFIMLIGIGTPMFYYYERVNNLRIVN